MKIKSVGILLLYWMFVCLPLFGPRYIPTHDGEFHIIRFMEFFKVLQSGVIIPRWAPDLNSGYGIPIFNFHYPFTNYIGALLHVVGFSFVDGFKVALSLGYGLAIFFCYAYLRRTFSNFIAVASTLIFATVPYWFVDIYVRGSIGEVWAFAWFMGAMASIAWKKPLFLTVSIGLLIPTHNIMAMLLLPIIFAYVFFFERPYLLSTVLGVSLSTYFWLPAIIEREYVTGLNSVTFSDHFPAVYQLLFPSWGTGFSQPGVVADEMSAQIGIIPLLIYVATGLSIAHRKRTHNNVIFFGIFSVCAVLLMLEISVPIWQFIQPLQLIQYPWRLLSVITISVPFLSSWVFRHWNRMMVGVTVLLSMLLVYSYTRPVTYEARNDGYYQSRKEFTDGTSSLGNSFSTIWSSWKTVRPLSRVEFISNAGKVSHLVSNAISDSFLLDSPTDTQIQVNRLYYPGWEAFIDNKKVAIDYVTNGVLRFAVPKGKHSILVHFGSVPLRTLANSLSLIAVAALVIMWRRNYASRI